MNNIQIISSGSYLPKQKVTNEKLSKELNITNKYIYDMTGIKERYYIKDETIEELAIKSVENLLNKSKFDKKNIDMIIVASTSTNKIMPGISYLIQKKLNINRCICLDILAGCSGYINALDIARNYIAMGKIEYVLVIGCDVLSTCVNKDDISTSIILADGAGATLIGKSNIDKKYISTIESNGTQGDILTYNSNEKLYMDGKAIYKYAVTDTIRNIKELLEISKEELENIKYIIPHQSNKRIMEAIANRLKISEEKVYMNIENVGNTFCASIPIALNEMLEKNLIKERDKIIFLGYGGGLNLGSILMEV